MQWLFAERGLDKHLEPPKKDNNTKSTQVKIPYFIGCLDTGFCWLDHCICRYFCMVWYAWCSAQWVAFVKLKLVRIWWHSINDNNLIMGHTFITRWANVRKKLENKYLPFPGAPHSSKKSYSVCDVVVVGGWGEEGLLWSESQNGLAFTAAMCHPLKALAMVSVWHGLGKRKYQASQMILALRFWSSKFLMFIYHIKL